MLSFYILFEVMLVVMYAYLQQHVVMTRALYALYMLATYTLVGSALLGIGLCIQYSYSACSSAMYTAAYMCSSTDIQEEHIQYIHTTMMPYIIMIHVSTH